MSNKIKFLFPFLALLVFACWPIDYALGYDGDINGHDFIQIEPVVPPVNASPIGEQGSSRCYGHQVPEPADYVENNSGEAFPYRTYITPEDPAIQALTARIKGVEEAYKEAVQWTYISEQELNNAADRWLTPHEFLTSTPHYSTNPLPGEEVSDCEEQANTLVSLLRAGGISPEEVRVALGEVIFNDIKIGHAWVELLNEGDWVALDPSLGPYWDDKAGELIRRPGISLDYYASHTYPVHQAWTYYNDVYLLEAGKGQMDVPVSWHTVTRAGR